jgi:hypothetical protein
MIVTTGTGKYVNEIPRFPWNNWDQYRMYWSQNEELPYPNRMAKDLTAEGDNGPGARATSICIGFPGMSRGNTKFNVTAAHAVRM